MKALYFVVISIFVLSCAKSKEEENLSLKHEALYYLTSGDCDKAQSALDDMDPDSEDSTYYSLYASVYECKAGFSQINTVLDNIDDLEASSNNLFKTLASFRSAQEVTAPDDSKYTNLLKALAVINSSTSVGGATQRISQFGETRASDLNFQALLITTIALSKYLGAYGNIDVDGTKGAGTGAQVCLAQYNYNNVNNIYLDAANLDLCTSATTSNAETSINTGDSEYTRKLCEGIILYNNFFDLLANLTLPADTSELGELEDVEAILETFKVAATAAFSGPGDGPAITTYENIRDVSSCETTAQLNATNANYLEAYYSAFLEGNHN